MLLTASTDTLLWLCEVSAGDRVYSHLLTHIDWTLHSWEEEAREIFLPLFAPTLEEANTSFTLWFVRILVLSAFLIQFIQWKTYHSSSERHFLRVERNTILSFEMPQSWKNRLDTSMRRASKWGGHLENHTPCSSQQPELFSDQTAELIHPSAESQSKAKELHFGNKAGMKVILSLILWTWGNFTLNTHCWNHTGRVFF